MSIRGYLSKPQLELRMPRIAEGAPDDLGIRWFGPVVTGRMSVQEALRGGSVPEAERRDEEVLRFLPGAR